MSFYNDIVALYKERHETKVMLEKQKLEAFSKPFLQIIQEKIQTAAENGECDAVITFDCPYDQKIKNMLYFLNSTGQPLENFEMYIYDGRKVVFSWLTGIVHW